MNWIETSIYTTHDGAEVLGNVLIKMGTAGFSVEDAQDFEEFVRTKTPYWDYVDESLERLRVCETKVTVYLADNEQGTGLLTQLSQEIVRLKAADIDRLWGRLEIETHIVCEEDWADNWKQYFRPTPVGKHILIKPSWESLDGMDTGGRKVLEIDPSASFGTGTHQTTRLCIELLEEYLEAGDCILDMGCGSGILGIAGMLLGARAVTAADIDENSVRIAGDNFALNHVDASHVHFFCGDVNLQQDLRSQICAHTYEVITANIVADVIIMMLPTLKACMARDSILLLSGIISGREPDVRVALSEHGMKVKTKREEDDWIALAVERDV